MAPTLLGRQLKLETIAMTHGTLVRLEGVIDESFDIRSHLRGCRQPFIFDLDGVVRITSYGVREWIANLDALRGYRGFVRCRPSIVAQFNMVAHFAAGGELLSFYLPYICTACGREIDILLEYTRISPRTANEIPPVTCADCEAPAEFDDVPATYFSYVSSAPRPNPPGAVAALMRGSMTTETLATAPLFRVRKTVAKDLTVLWLEGPLEGSGALRRVVEGLEGTVIAVLRDVVSADASGVRQLARIGTNAEATTLYLARVPVHLLWQFTDDADLGEAIVSVITLYRCPGCGSVDAFERTANDAITTDDEPPEHACRACGLPLSPLFGDMEWAELKSQSFCTPPPAVTEYLAAYDQPESEDDSYTGTDGTFGRYRLLQRIASGGMAEVFLARQLGPDGFERNVALKRILPRYCDDAGFIELFVREAQLAARLSHPGIVQIVELGKIGRHHFIAMEYVKGHDLQDIITRCRAKQVKMPIALACRIVADISEALSVAHGYDDDDDRPSPIIHRDVSPHNVLISDGGVVKLSDFGIARASTSVSEESPGEMQGKLSYFSPERLLGEGNALDPRQDIFSTGVVLYLCLTNVHPFRRRSDVATAEAILHRSLRPMAQERPDIDPELEAIVEKALARSPEERFCTARDLHRALESYILTRGEMATAHELSSWLRSIVAPKEVPPDESRSGAVAAVNATTDPGDPMDDTEPFDVRKTS